MLHHGHRFAWEKGIVLLNVLFTPHWPAHVPPTKCKVCSVVCGGKKSHIKGRKVYRRMPMSNLLLSRHERRMMKACPELHTHALSACLSKIYTKPMHRCLCNHSQACSKSSCREGMPHTYHCQCLIHHVHNAYRSPPYNHHYWEETRQREWQKLRVRGTGRPRLSCSHHQRHHARHTIAAAEGRFRHTRERPACSPGYGRVNEVHRAFRQNCCFSGFSTAQRDPTPAACVATPRHAAHTGICRFSPLHQPRAGRIGRMVGEGTGGIQTSTTPCLPVSIRSCHAE